MYPDRDSKWRAILEHVGQRHGLGQPVLIGTRTTSDAADFSRLLAAAQLPHQLLDAGEPGQAAAKLAGAGAPGSITVATHRDGLGADIALGQQARELGGLHVILSERYDAAYIDRQFSQRCARRGEPGSVVAMVSLDDELARKFLPPSLRKLLLKLGLRGAARVLRLAQLRQEQEHARARRRQLRMDQQVDQLLAFSGRRQ